MIIPRTLFAWLLYTTCLSVQAQESEYRLFAQEGKGWETVVGGTLENVYGNRMDGDTLIGGESWKKVYNYVGDPSYGYSYYAAVRDVGKKVYAIAKGSNRPRLLYAFGVKAGDLLRCGVEGNTFGCLIDTGERSDSLLGFPFVSFLRVERIDSIEGQDHHQLRRFTLTFLDAFQRPYGNGKEWPVVIWIEGVGSGAGPFSPWMPLPAEGSIYLKCGDGFFFCGYSDFYENAGIEAVSNTCHYMKGDNVIHDLLGRCLTGKPSYGLYIEDGRKVMVK